MTIALLIGPLACSGGDDRTTVNVFAASSLVDVMKLIEDGYESDNPEVDIRMNLAGTNALVRQINSGADAAILVAADAAFLDNLIEPLATAPTTLATNQLTLIVPRDNPAAISEPGDAGRDGTLTARCATGVPCGDATDRYVAASGVTLARATEEPNVRSVLTKVASGEADAGFVYRTDVLAAGGSVIELPLDDGPRVTVTMAQLSTDGTAADLASYLISPEVEAMFFELGFGPAESGADQE